MISSSISWPESKLKSVRVFRMEEEIASELRESELKQRNVREAWKELDDHFDSTRRGLRTRFQELQASEGEIGFREKLLEVKELRFEAKAKGLNEAEKRAEEGKSQLESLRVLIEKHEEELDVKEKRFSEVGELVREKEREYDLIQNRVKERGKRLKKYNRAIELKKGQLGSILKSMMECQSRIDSREKITRELELKGKEFCLLKKSMEDWLCKVELRNRELDGWVEVLEVKEKDVESKVEELHLIVERVSECLDDVQVKEEHFVSLEKPIQEQEMHLCSLQKLVQERDKELDSLSQELQRKERHLEEVELKMAKLGHTIPSYVSDHSSIHWDGRGLQMFMNEQLKRIYSMGSEMSAILKASSDPAKLVLDAMQGFYPSSSTLDNKETHFDLTVIRRSCILLLEDLKRMSPQINARVRNEAIKLAADWKTKMTVSSENTQEILGFLQLVNTYGLSSMYDAKDLQSLLAVVHKPEQASQSRTSIISSLIKTVEPESSLAINATTLSSPNSSSQNDMLASLLLVSDPAEHVLNSVQRSFSQYWKHEDVSFKERIMLNNMSLLECLTIVSPHIGPHVKEDAKLLAAYWKAKMTGNTENSVETLGFLLFISTYGLVSTLNTEEIIKLLEVISQNKGAVGLCQTHGYADKIADFIRILIERKQLMDAVGFICTFNLVDKLPPIPLLKQYVEDAEKCSEVTCSLKILHDEKVKIVDNLIADLRAGKQCIKEYHLECEYPYADIEMQIVQLEKLKENWRCSAPSLGSCIVESQVQRKRKKPNTSSSARTRAFPSQQQRKL